MIINDRCVRLMEYLINIKKPVTIQKLARHFGVSVRTIRYDLDKIDMWLDFNHFPRLVRKPNSGIMLSIECADVIKEALMKKNIHTYIMSPPERCRFILSILFSSTDPVNLKMISDRLQVSISTISNDLKNIKSWLNEFDISLISKPNYGIALEANEKNFRKAYIELLYEVLEQDVNNTNYGGGKFDLLIKQLENVYYFDDFKKLSDDERKIVIHGTKLIEKEGKVQFTDIAFTKLLLYLIVMVVRVKKGAFVSLETSEIHFLVNQKEYCIAQITMNFLEENLKLKFSLNETANLALNIMASKIMDFTENKNMGSLIEQGRLSVDVLSVTGQIIHEVQKLLDVNLENDKDLLLNLALHIKPLLYRLHYNLPCEKNPLLLEIKNSLPDIYGAAQKAVGKILFNKTNKIIEEDEIGYITMHLGAAIFKKMKVGFKNVDAVIVCGTGIGTAEMLSSRIKMLFSNINISKILSYHEFQENIRNLEYDVLLSTIPLDDLGVEYILVSPLLNTNDLEKLNKFFMLKPQNIELKSFIEATLNIVSNVMVLSEYQKMQIQMELLKNLPKQINAAAIKKNSLPSLKELLAEESIRLKVRVKDWRDAINYAGSLLVKQGFVDKKYVRSMIRCKEKLGSYIVIDKGIAMPHALPQGVFKPCFSLITLDEPVEFGHSENDPVDVVIVLATINNWIHIQALTEIMLILNDSDAMRSIREAANPNEILNLLQ